MRVPSLSTTKPLLSNKIYDGLKFTAQVLLPASGALYFGLAEIWHLPKATEVVGTIAVIGTFLGVVLGLSSRQYNRSEAKYDGAIEVEQKPEGKKVYSLGLNAGPEYLDNKDEAVFKIVKR